MKNLGNVHHKTLDLFQFGVVQDLEPEATAVKILSAISGVSFLPCLISATLSIQSGLTPYIHSVLATITGPAFIPCLILAIFAVHLGLTIYVHSSCATISSTAFLPCPISATNVFI